MFLIRHRSLPHGRALGPQLIVALCAAIVGRQDPHVNAATFERDVRPLVEKYCVGCHGATKPQAELNLTQFADEAGVMKSRKTWKKVWHALHAREMPPADESQPTAAERDLLTAWIETILDKPDADGVRDPGAPVMRRLTRTEFSNTVCDLIPSVRPRLAYRAYYDPAKGFPAEGAQLGLHEAIESARRLAVDLPADDIDQFDNLGETMTLSPVLMEQYLAVTSDLLDRPGVNADGRVFVARPGPNKPARQAAKEILAAFLPRAFRRPVTDAELADHLELFDLSAGRGDSFETAVKTALQAVLVSPHFLFRAEKDDIAPAATDAAAKVHEKIVATANVRPVGDYELAGRLSYFLWSTMPDDELLQLAKQGDLHKPEVFDAQVQRLLRSPKSKSLADNFAVQWLQLSDFETAMPDPQLFPLFFEDDYLGIRWLMRQEAVMFFEAVLMDDRSILDFLDADWAILNAGLVQHYGITGLRQNWPRVPRKEYETWHRVKLPDHRRGGVLTMSGVLAATSPPTRTSPVKRGKWILDNILGMPPPPPLPNAGTIPEESDPAGALSVRKKLERHRQDPACASCHRRMDPLGFALENYDSIGTWRTTEWDSIESDWRFDADDATEGWTSRGDIKDFAARGGNLSFTMTPGGGELIGPEIVKTPSIDKVVFRMKNGTKAKSASLTVGFHSGPMFGGRNITIPIEPESDFREYVFDLTKAPAWDGIHHRMQLRPANSGVGEIKIDWIRLGKRPAGSPEPMPIDASGTLPDGTKFDGPAEFKRVLVANYKDRFTRCLTEKMLTYALGRKLDYYDTSTVSQIAAAVAKEEYKFSVLVREITRSYPFQFRRVRSKAHE